VTLPLVITHSLEAVQKVPYSVLPSVLFCPAEQHLFCPAERPFLVLPSDSEASPTHLVISSVARNLLFDNWRPLGLRLGATKKRLGVPALFCRFERSEASLNSFGTASLLTSFGTALRDVILRHASAE
jgi:hypothetical protein